MAVGVGVILTSSDGSLWTRQGEGVPGRELRDVLWTGTQFVAVGDGFFTSPDGFAWTHRMEGYLVNANAVTSTGYQLVAVQGGTVWTSPDGVSWAERHQYLTALYDITWSGDHLVGVGQLGPILTSPDAISWAGHWTGNSQSLRGITWTGSQFVTVGDEGTILTSPDGVVWRGQDSRRTEVLDGIAWTGSRLVATGQEGVILVSDCSQSPSADFTWSPQTVLKGQQVRFTDRSTGAPTSWAWSFGDGTGSTPPGTSTAQNPVYAYLACGTFNVSLTASNATGSSSVSKQLTVGGCSGVRRRILRR